MWYTIQDIGPVAQRKSGCLINNRCLDRPQAGPHYRRAGKIDADGSTPSGSTRINILII